MSDRRTAGKRDWRTLFRALRQIAGMPDYEAYVAHLQQHHPETPIPPRQRFYEQFLESRYEGGPTRCC
jgi:uncharacterized short protein YbdD (DUF466 family)